MCDYGYSERKQWILRIERFRKEMEQEDLERQRKAAASTTPARPENSAVEPEPLPV